MRNFFSCKLKCGFRNRRKYFCSDARNLLQVQQETRKILLLIRTFKQYGHLIAKTDPLKMREKLPALEEWTHGSRMVERPYFAEFNLKALSSGAPAELIAQGFSIQDMDRAFYIGEDLSIGPYATLRDIVAECERIFCGSIGTEYQHLFNRDACKWVRMSVEQLLVHQLDSKEQKQYLKELVHAEVFERYLGRRFSGAKRFSIEGAESLIPGLNALLKEANAQQVEVVYMGMAHRGRLNVLANVLKLPLRSILSQFQPYLPDEPDFPNNSDDVRYHLGTTNFLDLQGDQKLEINLTSNPSHLEAVNSVVLGETRARQISLGDDGTRVLPLLLHGDAAMFQGSVREAFGFSQLAEYETGGTVHIIVNNQIGFTTLPKEADSATYCSDVAKISGAPVFHVNADDLEAVVKIMKLAIAYRQKFHRDVVIDLICYRRHGHNEQDSPEITAPVMYNHINKHPSAISIYGQSLCEKNILNKIDVAKLAENFELKLLAEHTASTQNPLQWDFSGDPLWRKDWFGMNEAVMREGRIQPKHKWNVSTGYDKTKLAKLGQVLFKIPSTFAAHKKVEAIMNNRLRAIESGNRVDWGTAEALAIGSLLAEGTNVRLAGQDCERGTFNQRHAVMHDQHELIPGDHTIFVPLQALTKTLDAEQASDTSNKLPGNFQICNSPLSEEGALAFEYGYSTQSTTSLTIWEAQFGDFANGAQTIIDTFIISGEQKWQRMSGLVMLLPHGYEGQGPEHSSARIERFLQLMNQDPDIYVDNSMAADLDTNIHIVCPSTPAQYFHVLRRQLHRACRKPLIIFTPKYLLHHRPCNSDLSDFSGSTSFVPVLGPHPTDEITHVQDEKVTKLLLCTGKMYYHLLHALRSKKIHDTVIVRIEQLAPFPYPEVSSFLSKYKNAGIVWAQEEPKNMGAWAYVQPRLATTLSKISDNRVIEYCGRIPSASPATGQYEVHADEMKKLIAEAITK